MNDTTNEKKTMAESLIAQAKNFRTQFEPRWYVSYNAYENNHFVVWLPESKTIQKVPLKAGKFFNQIPEVKNQVDTIQNMILGTEVLPIVYPVHFDPVSEYWAKKLSDYLLFLYKHWFFLGKLHDAVHDALVMPFSVFQLLPPDTNDGKMDLIELDAFDVLLPPGIKDIQSKECNYVIKTGRVPVMNIKKNEHYKNTSGIKSETQYSEADYKEMIMNERFGNADDDENLGTAVVNEMWIKEKQQDGKIKVRIQSFCQGKMIRDDLTQHKKLPFVSLKLHQGMLFQPSFVEYILPTNRSIDLFQSRVEDAALRSVRDVLLASYGSTINRTTDENGEIMYYRGQQKPEWLQRPAFPKEMMNYISMNFSFIERIGASAASIGAQAKGAKAYRTVESMKQQDFAGKKTPMDFMRIALTQLFNLVIEYASEYYLDPIDVKVYQRENYDVFKVLGEKGIKHNMDMFEQAKGNMTQAPVVAHPDNVVEVEFESALSYTMEGKRQTVFEAVKAGLLGKEDALRMLKLGNVRDILDNLQNEQQQQQQQDLARQEQQQTMNANISAQTQGAPGKAPQNEPPQSGGGQPNPSGGQPPQPPPQGGGGTGIMPQLRVGQ